MKKTPLKRKTPMKRAQAPLKRSRLKPVSEKRKKEGAEYSRLRKEFLEAHKTCQVEDCSCKSTQVHHKNGRRQFYLATTTWMAVCMACHDDIHFGANRGKGPAWAREKGYLV